MSTDEEMAVIGRLVIERKEIAQRNAALHEEMHRIATGLKGLAEKLTGGNSMFYKPQLTPDEAALLDAAKLKELLDDKRKVVERYDEIRKTLNHAGISD